MAIIPQQFYENDAGWDLTIPKDYSIAPGTTQKLRTGLQLTFPKNIYGEIHNRSSWPKFGLIIITGIVDNGFTGEIHILAQNASQIPIQLHQGDKVAQLLFYPSTKIQFAENKMILTNPTLKQREQKAFGSTNMKRVKKEEKTEAIEDLSREFEHLFNEEEAWNIDEGKEEGKGDEEKSTQ